MSEYLIKLLNSETLRYASEIISAWVLPPMGFALLVLQLYNKALEIAPKGVMALEREVTSRLRQLLSPFQNRSFQDSQRGEPMSRPD
jgi:hypothetical protein